MFFLLCKWHSKAQKTQVTCTRPHYQQELERDLPTPLVGPEPHNLRDPHRESHPSTQGHLRSQPGQRTKAGALWRGPKELQEPSQGSRKLSPPRQGSGGPGLGETFWLLLEVTWAA